MDPKRLSDSLSVSPQLSLDDIHSAAALGYKAIINNRPDGEQLEQPTSAEISAAAKAAGLGYRHIPVVPGEMSDDDIDNFADAIADLPTPILAFCRSGTRSVSLSSLAEAEKKTPDSLIRRAKEAGYDVAGLKPRLEARRHQADNADAVASRNGPAETFDVLIVGGGAGGIAVASSLRKRRASLSVAVIEPSDKHYYQAAFTLVGGGVFDPRKTVRDEARCIPKGVKWIRAAVADFEPKDNRVVLEDGERVGYRSLVVAPGLKLDWSAIEGLPETLGKNGVTSNYQPGLATYTWSLLQDIHRGPALFTQPPMPIKCAGAPQKIMYLACSYWEQEKRLKDIGVEFNNAGGVLFGVADFVPPLMKYIDRYDVALAFNANLVAVDGPAGKAWFDVTEDGETKRVEKPFAFLHVTPPQRAPDFIRDSELADDAGWLSVDQETLRSTFYPNIYGVGDVCSAPNAKTAAAVRKQSPVVVRNLIADFDGQSREAVYDGYGACPLTVERGRVILAEFGYGGKLQPSFPLNPTKPRWLYWLLKVKLLPTMYWDVLFRGREWGAKPPMRQREKAAEETEAKAKVSA